MIDQMPILAAHNLAMSLGEAYALLKRYGASDTQITIETIDKGTVFPEIISQLPGAGERIHEETAITLTINTGARRPFDESAFHTLVVYPLQFGNQGEKSRALDLLQTIFGSLQASETPDDLQTITQILPNADDTAGVSRLLRRLTRNTFIQSLFAYISPDFCIEHAHYPLRYFQQLATESQLTKDDVSRLFLQVARMHRVQLVTTQDLAVHYLQNRLRPFNLEQESLAWAILQFRADRFSITNYLSFVLKHALCNLEMGSESSSHTITLRYPADTPAPVLNKIHSFHRFLVPLHYKIDYEPQTTYLILDSLDQGQLDMCLLG